MQIHELNNFAGTPGDSNFLAIDNGSDTGKISGTSLLKPVNDRIDNLAASVTPDSVVTLIDSDVIMEGTHTLSESVANFDFLDFYFKDNDSPTGKYTNYVRVPRDKMPTNFRIPYSTGSTKEIYMQELTVDASGTTLTISKVKLWEWDGSKDSNATVQSNVWILELQRVDGIKTSSNTPAELADIRVGANGVTYPSAGDAVRGQYSELNDDIYTETMRMSRDDLSTGYYITNNGGYWGTASNANSVYTPSAINVSGLSTIKIRLSSVNSGGSRFFGFVDANGAWVKQYNESGTSPQFVLKNGMYEADFEVESDYFVFSYSTTAAKIYIIGVEPYFYPKESAELKFDKLLEYSQILELPDFLTGKYYDFNSGTQSLVLSNDANSIYTNELDLSDYIGGVLRIRLYGTPSTGVNRLSGFKDTDGLVRWMCTEGNLPFVSDGTPGHYIADLEIKYPKFLFSYFKTNIAGISIQAMRNTSLTKNEAFEELDVVKRYVGMELNDHPIDLMLLWTGVGATRLYSCTTKLDGIKKMTVDPIPGYQSTIMYGNTVPPSSGGNTGWSNTGAASVYNNSGNYQYAYVVIRKPDNSTMTSTDYENVKAAFNVHVANDELEVSGSGFTAYVSPTGSDTNTGKTRTAPFATIQKAIDSGAKTILVKEGTYTQGFNLNGLDGVSIGLDHYYDTFTVITDEDNPKVIIDGNDNSLQHGGVISGCTNCKISNFEVKNCTSTGFTVTRSSELRFDDCIVHDIGIGQSGSIGGIIITYSDADFYNCVAYNIGTTTKGTGAYHYDGFNIHGTGTTNFINCKAWNCEDDGISHHDACYGLVDGGEWYNCGKGGIATPTHGAKVNISNVYCHDNAVGIYAGNDNAVTDRGNLIFSNCVCKNNDNKDMIISDYYKVIAINCVYDTITGAGNVTRFGITS